MISLLPFSQYLNGLLQPQNFSDYCPNGLQVEGRDSIQKLVTGVTACQSFIDAAMIEKADAILVHHGFFWRGEDVCITGMKRKRLTTLLDNQCNLFAYHLPLDCHSEFGNNTQLGKLLKLNEVQPLIGNYPAGLVMMANLAESTLRIPFKEFLQKQFHREPLLFSNTHRSISKVAWCSGGGENYIFDAIRENCDAFITGEISEKTVHIAHENLIHLYAVGHHASERYAVQALGEHLADKFALTHKFLDVDNYL